MKLRYNEARHAFCDPTAPVEPRLFLDTKKRLRRGAIPGAVEHAFAGLEGQPYPIDQYQGERRYFELQDLSEPCGGSTGGLAGLRLHVSENHAKKSDLTELEEETASRFKAVKDGNNPVLDVLMQKK